MLKLSAAGALVALALTNAYAASIPRYTVRGSEVTYPTFNPHDSLRILPLPVILGPSTDTYLPTRITVNLGNLVLYPLNSTGVIKLSSPTTVTPNFGCNLVVSGYRPSKTTVTYYGISLGKTSIVTPAVNTLKIRRYVGLIIQSGSIAVVYGKFRVTRGVKSAIITGKYKLISIVPEELYQGVYTWRIELRLRQLLSLLSY
ncbi:hypothetical protein [Methanopyrus sp.]